MHFITSGDFQVPENIIFEDIGNKKLKVYRVKNIDKEINGKIERKDFLIHKRIQIFWDQDL